MKKWLVSALVMLLVLVVLGFVFKAPLKNAVVQELTSDMFVPADTDEFNPGVAVGEIFPAIDATYQGKQVNSLDGLMGGKGTVFVVSRSLVWCPYCMKQMVQLNDNLAAFTQAGINVVGLTYDSPAGQQPFKDKFAISYPILSDNNAATVKQLGILNEQYQPGDDAYGIGHPGAFIVDNKGLIAGKIFLEAYSVRVDPKALLDFASSVLN